MATKTKKAKQRDVELFVDGDVIVDQKGRTLTTAEARQLWEAHRVANYNLAFQRLATQFDFDMDKLREFYASH
jgi:hypothetical protein